MSEACSNFHFPVPEILENALVKLVPFIIAEHAETFFSGLEDSLFAYLPWGPYATTEDYVNGLIETRVRPDPGMLLFAVFDKASGALAGTIGLLDTSPVNLSTEVAWIITLPAFQRTYVTSNATGLLLHWVLDAPAQGGLGLRRVNWKATTANKASVGVAERMGFRMEGVARWDRVLPEWKTVENGGNGITLREGDRRPNCIGIDVVSLGLCWDEWEDGGRDLVDKVMSRR
ncbi:acyl-CoA N-acyltransferase [Roridomyces roridus]|uniref:Acyl-CoA N-acyltransferase n=1 Tax=Roridomyces roridus TaxID=1738132 RepID=A0AAD7BD27_9AGAR|nr:acyl-CoA N-acyltransferase [Roridomyces roridus]